MATGYQRPVLCRLCRFPTLDGGVPVSQVDREKLSEWCLRVMDTELNQEGLEKAVFCQFCICDASFEEENSHLASNGCWKTFSSDVACLEKYYSDGLIRPCAVQMTILSKKQIRALTYKKPNCSNGEYFCVYCGQRLEAKQHMIHHVKMVHSNIKTFYCFECQTYSKSLLALKQHQVTHHRQCNFCSEVLESKVKYRAHVKKMHKAYAFQCSYNTNCSAFFKSEEERREHVEKVHESGKWKKWCIYCKKMITALGYHMKKHHRDVAIPCNYDKLCNDHFLTQEDRLKHILEKHEAEKKSKSHLRCFFCNKLAEKTKFPRHMKEEHPSEVVFKCNFHQKCASYFLTEEQRKKHILEKHESGDDKVKCVYCQKMIIADYINDHVKVYHKTETIIKCDFFVKNCRAYFLTQEEKEEHIKKVHLTKRLREQAKCIYCNKILLDKFILVSHVNFVHPDVKIKCPFHKCQEFFHTESERDEHFLLMHKEKEDRKIYKCNFCDHRSGDKRSLRLHTDIKHGTQNIKCPQCGKMYKSEYALWSHTRTTHKQSERCQFCNRNSVAMHSHLLRSVCKFCKQEVLCKGLSAKHLRECKPKARCAICNITFNNNYERFNHLRTNAHKL